MPNKLIPFAYCFICASTSPSSSVKGRLSKLGSISLISLNKSVKIVSISTISSFACPVLIVFSIKLTSEFVIFAGADNTTQTGSLAVFSVMIFATLLKHFALAKEVPPNLRTRIFLLPISSPKISQISSNPYENNVKNKLFFDYLCVALPNGSFKVNKKHTISLKNSVFSQLHPKQLKMQEGVSYAS